MTAPRSSWEEVEEGGAVDGLLLPQTSAPACCCSVDAEAEAVEAEAVDAAGA